MTIPLFLYSPVPGRKKDLEKILKSFCKRERMLTSGFNVDIVTSSESGEGYVVELEVQNPWGGFDAGKENLDDDLLIALIERLYINVLREAFIPLNDKGEEIFVLPPYGFNILFYHDKGNRQDSLEKIIVKLGQEIPAHEGKFKVAAHAAEDEPGEYYFVEILIQDNWPEQARERLKLAFYFRLLLLAKNKGFQPVFISSGEEE